MRMEPNFGKFIAMAFNTWSLEDDEGLFNSEGMWDTWITHNEEQNEYFSQTHFHGGTQEIDKMTSPSLLAMASPPPPPLPLPTHISMPTPTPSSIPIPRPPPPPSPPVNFGQFSRPIVAAKAILQKAGAAKVPSKLAPNRKSGVENCPESKSGLTSIGSSGAPSHPTRRTSLELRCLREEVSLDYPFADSGDCSEKTRNDSSDCLLIREFDLKAEDKKYSVGRKSGISKRRRVAKLHNTSEKRRRDRINEKIKTLQHLIPNSCKTDKSSILDEAIEYLKHLQHQIQYVSMQSGMGMQPLMLLTGMQMPNTYHRMGPMGMGMVTGLGMGMGHPVSQMASTQTILGQGTTTSEQLHPSFYVVNPTNGYTGVQSSVINTPYDMHFAQSLVDQNHKQQ